MCQHDAHYHVTGTTSVAWPDFDDGANAMVVVPMPMVVVVVMPP
jgi:hypothetical protein